MTDIQFCYWLKGFLETANPKTINEEQTQIIKDHLNLVFNKITPNYPDGFYPSLTNPASPFPDHLKTICGNSPDNNDSDKVSNHLNPVSGSGTFIC